MNPISHVAVRRGARVSFLPRTCGREIFSRGRKTLNGLVSVTGGGIWYGRINGF